jgi:cellulose synthase/poly-beta-1,6-N-acetylglucosamine synthase-like glycosyltransferase
VNYFDRLVPNLSAKRRLDVRQWLIGAAVGLALVCALFRAPIATIVVLNTLFIAHSLAVLGLRATILLLSLQAERVSVATKPGRDPSWPVITILCPVYREEKGLPGLVAAIRALDYPEDRLDVKILVEADDEPTRKCAERHCSDPMFDIVIVPPSEPRTKPKACNYALWSALGEYLVIYDAEDRPEPGQLKAAARAFAELPDEVCCLQARLNYYNREQTWITRLFAIEYALLFDLVLPGLDRLRAPLPLGGTSNFFRTRTLLELGGWDPFNVTEDADLGLRMAAAGYQSRVLDTTTYEEATPAIGPWLRQRSRWIKGYMQTWLVHARQHGGQSSPRIALTLHFLVGGVVVAALFNPVFWSLYAIWLFSDADWIKALFPAPLDSLATFSLLAGNLFHIWLFMLAPLRREWFDLVPYAFLAPAYWALQSIAGYKAFWQFLFRPSYWEKTSHGKGISPRLIAAKLKAGRL